MPVSFAVVVLGAAVLVGGLRRDRQQFDRTAATVQAAMLLLAAAAMVMPAIYQLASGGGLPRVGDERVDFGSSVESLSAAVAIVLLLTYGAGLLFSLRTHRDVFNPVQGEEEHVGTPWSVRRPSRSPSPASPSAACRRSWSGRSRSPPPRSRRTSVPALAQPLARRHESGL